jgi:hypothetical protein
MQHRFFVLFCALSLCCGTACGDDDSSSDDDNGSAGDGGKPSGGSGGSAAGGGAAGGGAAGDGAGKAGSGGSAGSGDAGGDLNGADPPKLSDVDLTLGGFNDDLPAPERDCLALDEAPLVGCISISGEYNSEPFDFFCMDSSPAVTALRANGAYANGCRLQFAEDDKLLVALRLGSGAIPAVPYEFSYSLPPGDDPLTHVEFERPARALETHAPDTSGQLEFVLGDTHEQEMRTAGVAEYGPGWSAGKTSAFTKGTFAASLRPKDGCDVDAEGFGCDEVRLRGNFWTRPEVVVLMP